MPSLEHEALHWRAASLVVARVSFRVVMRKDEPRLSPCLTRASGTARDPWTNRRNAAPMLKLPRQPQPRTLHLISRLDFLRNLNMAA